MRGLGLPLAARRARTPEAGRWIGLGILRREVTDDTALTAAGVPARAVDLPFSLPYLEPA